MNQITNDKRLNLYFKKVKDHLQLTYSKKQTLSILQNLKKNAYTYFEENPTATFEDFETYFGSPENISIDVSDYTSIKNDNLIIFKKKCYKTIVMLTFVLLVFIGCLVFKQYLAAQDDIPVRIDIEIEEGDK